MTMKTRFKDKPIRLYGKAKQDLNNKVLDRDNRMCQNPYCADGWPLDYPHHIVFKSRGGGDTEENLITLCRPCHDLVHAERLNITGEWPKLQFKLKGKK